METCRFFVSNLPLETTEKDLKKLFRKYGVVENVELKIKENVVNVDDKKIIAFVTLQIESKEAQNCINNLQYCTLHGQQISVTLAKESFLERLKRERVEALLSKCDNSKRSDTILHSKHDIQSNIVSQNNLNKRITFNIYEDVKDDYAEPELVLTKKRAADSIHNGKIVIQSQAENKPLHIIENQKTKRQKLLNVGISTAEQKRKKSVNKMKEDYKQKKTAIQQALKGLDHNLDSRKTTFSDQECETNSHIQNDSFIYVGKKTQLFSDDDNDVCNENTTKGEELKLNSLLMGRKGSQLAKLQSNQTLDARFHMDEKFLESESDDEVTKIIDENCKTNNSDEYKWQMKILEQVMGSSNLSASYDMGQRMQKYKQLLRYDPNNKEHQNNAKQEEKQTNKTNKSKLLEEEKVKAKEITQESNAQQVSKERFYMVTDTLQESLNKPSEGFSLLSMFNNSQYLEERHEQLQKLSHEKILLHNNKLQKCLTENPFNYESSSTESEADDEVNDACVNDVHVNTQDNKADDHKNQTIKSKLKISQEPFFITPRDKRLEEGANFFRCGKKLEIENYDEVRQRLKQIIKTKISKTKKSMMNAGFKAKKKIKR